MQCQVCNPALPCSGRSQKAKVRAGVTQKMPNSTLPREKVDLGTSQGKLGFGSPDRQGDLEPLHDWKAEKSVTRCGKSHPLKKAVLGPYLG